MRDVAKNFETALKSTPYEPFHSFNFFYIFLFGIDREFQLKKHPISTPSTIIYSHNLAAIIVSKLAALD